jgi:hypothetical protein
VLDSVGVAHGMSAVLSHLSAARFWGWEVASPLDVVEAVVPRDRRAPRATRVVVRRRDLAAGDVTVPGVTSPLRTVLDVASDHPFPTALAVADSARRMKVARAADPRADNQFESAAVLARCVGKRRTRCGAAATPPAT